MIATGYKNTLATGLLISKDEITPRDAAAYGVDYLQLEDGSKVYPPEPETAPVTDVEIGAGKMAARRAAREDTIFSATHGLVGTCYALLQRPCTVAGEEGTQSLSAGAALAAGQGLCSTYGNQLRAWCDFGVMDFYIAMAQPDPGRPWLEWVPDGEAKSIRLGIRDRIYTASFGTAPPQ